MSMVSLYCGEGFVYKLACKELKSRFRRIKTFVIFCGFVVVVFPPLVKKGYCCCAVLFLFTYPILYNLFSSNVVVVILTYIVSQLIQTWLLVFVFIVNFSL